MLSIIYLIISTAFFAKLGDESTIPRYLWGVISIAVYFVGCQTTGGLIIGGMVAHFIFFIVLCIIWVVKPRTRRQNKPILMPVTSSHAVDAEQKDNPYRPPGLAQPATLSAMTDESGKPASDP